MGALEYLKKILHWQVHVTESTHCRFKARELVGALNDLYCFRLITNHELQYCNTGLQEMLDMVAEEIRQELVDRFVYELKEEMWDEYFRTAE